jgi:nucleoporin NUP159
MPPPQRIAVPAAQLAQSQQRPVSPLKPVGPETSELEDQEDDRIKALLAEPLEPRQDVPAFLAHQDYVARGGEKSGLLGQIERVYRDINSMIDTLGLNARSMREFVEGNKQREDAEPRDRMDLDDDSTWTLGEANSLPDIMAGIERELDDGSFTDIRGALDTLREEEASLIALRTRSTDAGKRIKAHRDPEQLAQQHAAPLPMETQALQSELRQEVQQAQVLLAKAEEGLTVLRAELASSSSTRSGEGQAVPTVEAVEKTIRKMTGMVEQRSGDIDVLESQIRRLGGPAALRRSGAVAEGYEDDLIAGMKLARLNSPANLRTSQLRASAYGSPRRSTPGRGTPVRGTPGSFDGRRSLMNVGKEEVESFRAKKEARAKVMGALRDKVSRRGPRVVRVGDV